MYKERIKDLRDYHEITQEVVANYIGINKGLYSQYEIEYTIMPTKHLNTIANYFNVSLDYIFKFTNEVNYQNIKKDIDKKLSGKRLKEFRKERGITQVEFSKILNVSRTTITEYERGTNIIATPFLYTICKKYNISADYLLGRIDSPKYLKETN